LASLELGKSSVQDIAKKADIKRPTAYVIIEELMQKGLMSSVTQDKKQYFFAESPEKLNILFREQEQEIQRKKEYLDKILPELNSVKALSTDKPVVRYFEGKDGLRAMSEEFFSVNHNEPARMLYSVDLLHKTFSQNERTGIRKKRTNRKIKTKVFYSYKDDDLESDNYSQRIKVDENKFPIEADIAIFKNKVRLATMKDKFLGMIIEDDEIVKTLKSLFEMAWKRQKENRKKTKQNKNPESR
ncbi:MAG: helix-turn-helix domain-containing protein, partial [Candidatus Moraniibacteriota bacterium]